MDADAGVDGPGVDAGVNMDVDEVVMDVEGVEIKTPNFHTLRDSHNFLL